MSSEQFIIENNYVSREDWHNNNIEELKRLFFIFENKIKEHYPFYKIKTPVDTDKFNNFSIMIYLNSSGKYNNNRN
jgi:hypothetical protein